MGKLSDRDWPGQFSDQRVTLALRLLETTDLHGQARGYDYFNDRPAPRRGLAALASEIAQARSEAPNCLLFDCGDFLQGTPLTQLWSEPCKIAGSHDGENPMIAAMNALGYDAAALGNHEFDFGIGPLAQALEAATFPMLCANLSASIGTPIRPWAMLERRLLDSHGNERTLRIAVIGVLPPPSLAWLETRPGAELSTSSLLEATEAQLQLIRASGADLVIALAHTGISPLPPGDEASQDPEHSAERAALLIARLDGVDIVLAGHDHHGFPDATRPAFAGIDPVLGTLHGKPALNAGARGTHLGVLDLVLEQTQDGWRLAAHRAELRPAQQETGPDSAAVLAASDRAHRRTLDHIRRPIGTTAEPLHSYFTQIAPDRTLALISAAKRRFARERLAGRPEADLPLLGAASSFKSGGAAGSAHFIDIPPGPLRMSHVDDIYLFNNTVGAVELNGAELRDWLEQAASIYNQQHPDGQLRMLCDLTFASYHFDVISGITYEIDLSQPPRFRPDGSLRPAAPGRIRDLRHEGARISNTDRFIVVSNDFRLSGGGGFKRRGRPVPIDPEPVLVRDLLLEEIDAQEGPLHLDAPPIWRFSPLPGARALYHTGPGAAAYLCELEQAGLRASSGPVDANGFLPLEISL
ncbi:5'-nucleotidase C-terminal domain-containing protein [Thioclava sediminum]|uniref:5'-nucleotidase C-terminal domain-containing protein n=1 Tax=Thioclava sediminum TaxID=1915319 RepID=UPI00099875B0|nr:5'-nucleotidase C-terminal domain-containing protein [Thioclava sediminum]